MTTLSLGSPVWIRVYKDIWVPGTVTAVSSTSFDAEEDDGGVWERWFEDEGTEWRVRSPEDVDPIGDFNDGISAVVNGMATWTGPMDVEVIRDAISKMKRQKRVTAEYDYAVFKGPAPADTVVAAIDSEVTERILQADAEEIPLREKEEGRR